MSTVGTKERNPITEQITLASTTQAKKIAEVYGGHVLVIYTYASNTSDIYIGDALVNAKTGFPIAKGGSLSVNLTQGVAINECVVFYALAATANDKLYTIII